MDKVIWKFELPSPITTHSVPYPYKVLTAQMQDGLNPVVWIEVPANNGVVRYLKFVCIPTGFAAIPDGLEYINTVQMPDGLVYHVYYAERS